MIHTQRMKVGRSTARPQGQNSNISPVELFSKRIGEEASWDALLAW